MRRVEREIKDLEIIQKMLKKAIICRVAFYGEEYPYVVPMNYGYHNNVLYFHCANEGKKLDLIRINPKVGFEITAQNELVKGKKSCQWTETYRSIFGTGVMEIVTDFAEKQKGLDVLMQHHGKVKNAYDPQLLERIVVLKLTINAMTAKENA